MSPGTFGRPARSDGESHKQTQRTGAQPICVERNQETCPCTLFHTVPGKKASVSEVALDGV
jgi:hypothetical protein